MEVMRRRPVYRKKARITFVFFVIASLLVAIWYYRSPDVVAPESMGTVQPGYTSERIHIPHYEVTHVTHTDMLSADELEYKRIMEEYDKLSSMFNHKYQPSDLYIDIGPAVSSLGIPSSRQKLVLLWTATFGRKSADWIRGAFENCPSVLPCAVTTNEDDLLRSDAVIIHPRDMQEMNKPLPAKRHPWQRWVYYLQESPFMIGANLSDFYGVFNWTATYRLDSGFPTGYGGLEKKKIAMTTEALGILTSEKTDSKRKLVVARISNCFEKFSQRLAYIAELRKHISVDLYGRCGNMSFPDKHEEGDALLKQYKFYLAFENAKCRDYISEKFWLPLTVWWSVPVVMGAAPDEYESVAPRDSFIHTAGFESPKHLAEYLHLLDRNPHLYRRYFKWHQYWEGASGTSWCKLCLDLNNMSLPVKYYRNFKGWYNEDTCKV